MAKKSRRHIKVVALPPWKKVHMPTFGWSDDPRSTLSESVRIEIHCSDNVREELLSCQDSELGRWLREQVLSAPEWEAEERREAEGRKKPRGKSSENIQLVLDLSRRAFAIYHFLRDARENNDGLYKHLLEVFRISYKPSEHRATPQALAAYVVQQIFWEDDFTLTKPLDDLKHFKNTYLHGRHRPKGSKPSQTELKSAKESVQWAIAFEDPPAEWLYRDGAISEEEMTRRKKEHRW